MEEDHVMKTQPCCQREHRMADLTPVDDVMMCKCGRTMSRVKSAEDYHGNDTRHSTVAAQLVDDT